MDGLLDTLRNLVVFPFNYFDIPPKGECSGGVDAFRFFFKQVSTRAKKHVFRPESIPLVKGKSEGGYLNLVSMLLFVKTRRNRHNF